MAERRLFEDVADTIRRLILDGTYPPGTRLPGERELSERFEVSRVTIREAEIALQASAALLQAQVEQRGDPVGEQLRHARRPVQPPCRHGCGLAEVLCHQRYRITPRSER